MTVTDEPVAIDDEVLRRLPKVELHCHLEGSIRAATLVELAATHGIPLPTTDHDALYRYPDLAGFLVVYETACSALRTAADFARVTYEALEDAVLSSNVRYREMFFNPTLHPGTPYPVMLEGILDGIRAAERDHGITTRLIPSIYRQDPVASALELVATVAEHRDDHVVGIGMDGDELADPPERFVAVYRAAAAIGLHRSAHVAHDGPASMIETCLDDLGCERVDHGYHVVDDPSLVSRLRDAGTTFLCATPTPPLCGWSDVFDESPVRRMIEAGLRVTLNSDDPPMLHTDLGTEFVKVCNGWRLTPERTKQLVTDAIDAAWCDPTERAALARSITPELDRMLGLSPG
ncbi:MAG: adenosine deaminase [Actinobacteria bacterium]|nr:adenosine deaminase [Actinomycetota bacterium]